MKNLTEGSIAKGLISFSIPLFIGNLFQQLFSIVDAIAVGKIIGEDALAAVGVSGPLIFLMISVVMGISTGGSVVLSKYFGAKDEVNFRKSMHSFYAILILSSLVVSVIGVISAEPILRLIGTQEVLIAPARDFLQVTFAGMFFVFMYSGVSAVLRSVGNSKQPLYFIIISSVANIAIVLFFVGVLHWGVIGSAFATLIAQAISFFLSLAYIQKKANPILKVELKELRFEKVEVKKILDQGIPGALQMGLVSLSYVALVAIINPFSKDFIAGYTAAGRLDGLAILPAMNISMAISTFVAQHIGAKKLERIPEGLKVGIILSSVLSIFFTLILILLPSPLLSMFAKEPLVIQNGIDYLHIVAPFYVIFSLMFCYMGVLRGAGLGTFSMLSTTVATWLVRLPVCLIFSLILPKEYIWWGIPIGWAVGFLMTSINYHAGWWKKKL